MAWKVTVEQLDAVKPHSNADTLELAYIGGWQLVVRKGEFKSGDKVVYFPQDTLMPHAVLEKMGLVGKLAGPEKRRVKAIRLRGESSIGLVMHAQEGEQVGDDVTEKYGCEKWELPVPVQCSLKSGRVISRPRTYVHYDVEHIRSPRIKREFVEGEFVFCLEKIDGCNVAFGLVDNAFVVCSRNYGIAEDDKNDYWKVARKYEIESKIRRIHEKLGLGVDQTLWIHGEMYGPIQVLKYNSPNEPLFAGFDLRSDDEGWMDWLRARQILDACNIPAAPLIYYGPFDYKLMEELATGPETISGTASHIREGIVIRKEKGHTLAKMVNPAFLEL